MLNITDIPGVRVGHVSLSRDTLRTGVTAVLPHGGNLYRDKVTGASAVLRMNLLFRAAVEGAEEAIVDALFAAETTTGRDGHTMPALPIPETLALLRKAGVRLR